MGNYEAQSKIAFILAQMIELMDDNTKEHIERTAGYVKTLIEAMIEKRLYINELAKWDIDTVVSSSRFHDIGKIAIPSNLLFKADRLTCEEYAIVRTHVQRGVAIIKLIAEIFGNNEFLQHAILFAENHHEKWDGAGYPNGLAETLIPLHGRIMAVVDVYDALTSIRPYKEAMSHEEAINIRGVST